ncbi:MAG: hypothetical protein JWP81_1559 [Ferruginibacter sp.]|nr:hypothetical protein [Ferruginibacter sp.]
MQRLREIFHIFHLDDFRDEITKWQQLALANDQSVYDEGNAREDLIDFCHEFLKLIESLHVLNKTNTKKHKNKWKKNLSNAAKKIIGKMNQPILLNEEEKVNPQLVIKRFCKSFSYSYTKIEILDLLEAVITYEGEKKVYKGNLVLFYQCMKCLLRMAYTICKNKN